MLGKKLLIGILTVGMLPFLAQPAHAATEFKIETYAGGGTGEGGPAVNAILSGTADAASVGSVVYVSELTGNRIRKITSTGTISTVSGTSVSAPRGLIADGSGNLIIADTGNNRIRKIDGSGAVSTIAGTGSSPDDSLSGPRDVAADGSDIYIADTGNHKVKKIDAAGVVTTFAGTGASGSAGDGGPAEAAELGSPTSLAIDPGAPSVLYVGGGGTIRKIVMSVPSVITTLPGAAGGLSPLGMTLANGTLYASLADRTVVAIDPSSGNVSNFAGTGASGSTGDGGSPSNATFMRPLGLGQAPDGAILIADDQASRVRRVWGGTIEAFAGNGQICFAGDGGPAKESMMGAVEAIAVDGSGNVTVADGCSARVRKIASSGNKIITTIAGNGTYGPALNGPALLASFGGPIGGIAAPSSSVVYVSDTVNNAVRKIESGQITTVATFASPTGLAVDSSGNLYVSSGCRVWKYAGGTATVHAGTGTCGLTGEGGAPISAISAQISPNGLAVDGLGRVYIAEAGNNRVRRVQSDGTIVTIAGATAGLNGPTGVAVGAGGVVYIADQGNNRIQSVRGDGLTKIVAGTGTAGFSGDGGAGGLAKLSAPVGLGIRTANLYVADTSNGRVRKISLPDQNPPVSAINKPLDVNQSNQASVQVTGKTEPKAVVTLTASDGVNPPVQPAIAPSVNSLGNWTASIDVTGMTDGTITFAANVVDEHGNIGAPVSTTAIKDTVGSSTVQNLTAAASNAKITLSWRNDDPAIAGVMVRKRAGTVAPASRTEGDEVPATSATSAVADQLQNCEWYSFAVFARDTAGNFSPTPATTTARPLSPTAPATALSIGISTGVVNYGEPIVISGDLHRAGTAENVPAEKVHIQVRRRGTTSWSTLTPQGIDTTRGRFTFMYKPVWSADYRIRHIGTACAGDSTSGTVYAAVRPILKASINPSTVTFGGTAVVSGTISPAQYGMPITLQRLVSGGKWSNVATTKMWGSGTTFAFTIKPTAVGRSWYRVYKPADSDHAGVFSPGVLQLSAVRVVITGIMYDPPGEDQANINGEYVTLRNTGSVAVDLFGWSIYGVGKAKKIKLPHYTLNPGQQVLLHSGSGTQTTGHIYLARTTPFWKNQSDTGQLYDPRGNLASSFRYQ